MQQWENINVSYADYIICYKNTFLILIFLNIIIKWFHSEEGRDRTPFQRVEFLSLKEWVLENSKHSSQRCWDEKQQSIVMSAKLSNVFTYSNTPGLFSKIFCSALKPWGLIRLLDASTSKQVLQLWLVALSKITFCSDGFVLYLCFPILCGFWALKVWQVQLRNWFLNCIYL